MNHELKWSKGLAVVLAVWLLTGSAAHLFAQTKRDTGPAEKANKGLSLKEARRLALENSYDLLQAKKQLMDKKITRTQYDTRVAGLLVDVEEAYMDLYVAREELQVLQRRVARGSAPKTGSRRADAKPPASPQVAEQDKALAQARQLAEFIPLEHEVKLHELQLKALLNSKTYPLRSDTELVLTDRPVAMKKEIDVDALIDKALALDHAGRGTGTIGQRGRAAHMDRSSPPDLEQDKKRTILAVKRAALKAIASIKRLEIATQVKDMQQKRLELLRAANADPAEIAAAEEAVEDAGLAELRAIVANNSDLLDLAEMTGTLQKDLGTNLGD